MKAGRFVPLLAAACLLLALPAGAQPADDGWPAASAEKLPRWRGFNLLNKFQAAQNRPFDEDDFRLIHQWGFNFVRLPMDYRIWITGGDWTKINEAAFRDIDQAVAWGAKYHIHVCLNFHRAPGYTVAQPPEARSVWTDPEAQRVCAMHWAAFARHYRGIPGDRLSFDLFNEPPDIEAKVYAKVIGLLVEAIRREDPDRLVMADGLAWGAKPCPELIPLHVAQATRGYFPMELTHYQASWIRGSDRWPAPTWPLEQPAPDYLYGPWKKDLASAMTLRGDFPAGSRLVLSVGTVSTRGRLVIRADGRTILEKAFVSGPAPAMGEKVVFLPQYQCYQNVFHLPLEVALPAAARTITLSNEDGDWLTLDALAVQPGGAGVAFPVPLEARWGQRQGPLDFDPARGSGAAWSGTGAALDRAALWREHIEPWQALQARGAGVMVGEWGCFDRTPYDVTLRWMEDVLANFRKADWGWALWNFSGSFGVLDSNRPGAVYEEYQGHKLDRRMLELLQRY